MIHTVHKSSADIDDNPYIKKRLSKKINVFVNSYRQVACIRSRAVTVNSCYQYSVVMLLLLARLLAFGKLVSVFVNINRFLLC